MPARRAISSIDAAVVAPFGENVHGRAARSARGARARSGAGGLRLLVAFFARRDRAVPPSLRYRNLVMTRLRGAEDMNDRVVVDPILGHKLAFRNERDEDGERGDAHRDVGRARRGRAAPCPPRDRGDVHGPRRHGRGARRPSMAVGRCRARPWSISPGTRHAYRNRGDGVAHVDLHRQARIGLARGVPHRRRRSSTAAAC